MRRLRNTCLALGLGAAVIAVGCGINGADSLFASGSGGSGPGAGGHGASGNPTAGGKGQGGDTHSDVGGSPTTTSSSGGGTPVSSSMMSSSTGMHDDLVCGDTKCPRGPNRGCCWDTFMQDAPPYAKCVEGPPDQPNQTGCNTFQGNNGYEAYIECALPSHCPGGQVCCGHRVFIGGGNAYYDLVSCQNTCTNSNVQLCDPTLPDALTCPIDMSQVPPVQEHCQVSQLLPTDDNGTPEYYVCSR